jgi:hypothetical protein
MSISLELRGLIKKMENMSDNLLVKAARISPELFSNYVNSIARSTVELEKLAESVENQVTPDMLENIVSIANSLDNSEDPRLKKQALILDDLLITITAQMKNHEAEMNRLREKHRTESRENLYTEPKKSLDRQNLIGKAREAVDNQLKVYDPLEAPLQTRYSPDMPGTPTTRIADGVYQDVITGKVYNYRSGYTTNKGNKIPGTSVENQIPDIDNYQQSRSIFETRDNLMGRYANDNGLSNVLKALGQDIPVDGEFGEIPIDGDYGALPTETFQDENTEEPSIEDLEDGLEISASNRGIIRTASERRLGRYTAGAFSRAYSSNYEPDRRLVSYAKQIKHKEMVAEGVRQLRSYFKKVAQNQPKYVEPFMMATPERDAEIQHQEAEIKHQPLKNIVLTPEVLLAIREAEQDDFEIILEALQNPNKPLNEEIDDVFERIIKK